jgi:hypothetical protein
MFSFEKIGEMTCIYKWFLHRFANIIGNCWSASISGDEIAKEHKSESRHFEASEKDGLLRQTYRAVCELNRAVDTYDTHWLSYCVVCGKKDTVEHDIKISSNLGKSLLKTNSFEFLRERWPVKKHNRLIFLTSHCFYLVM